MKILIIGARGLLGKAVTEELKNYEIFTPTSKELDITKREKVEKYVLEKLPNIIINCAAYTNVDKAEVEKEHAYNINCVGTLNLAQICNKFNITLMHISTDYVFDGKKAQYYSYKEDDELYLNPITMYGITKLQGEKNIINLCKKYYILRTSWLFGDGKNFIRTIIRLSKENSEINVVNDQFGNPTYTVDLASIINQIIIKQIPYGIYNATNIGSTSWYELAKKVLTYTKSNCIVNPISTQNSDRKAVRPKNSRLDVTKLLKQGIEIPTYDNALERFLKIELKEM